MVLDPIEVVLEALVRYEVENEFSTPPSAEHIEASIRPDFKPYAQAVVEALGIEFDAQRLSWGSKPYAYQSYRLKGLEGKETV